jgi:CheY-like chemotaxis protein
LEGHEIVEAADGQDAVDKATASPPALVMTETRLPGLDGYAVCKSLRRDNRTSTVPIIVATAEATRETFDLARAAGADLVFLKPIPLEALLREIRTLTAPPLRGTRS